jgi:hypothetical protein
MPRRKVIHCGTGPPVHDRSGWRIAAGDPPLFLPRAADATVLRALADKRLVYADETAEGSTVSVDDDATGDEDDDNPEAKERSNRLTLVECAKSLIATGADDTLTSAGKPTVEALKALYVDSGGDPDFEITAALRDEVTDEANDIGDGQ